MANLIRHHKVVRRPILVATIQRSSALEIVNVINVSQQELARLRSQNGSYPLYDEYGNEVDRVDVSIDLINTKRKRKKYLDRNEAYNRSLQFGQKKQMSDRTYIGSKKLPWVA